MIHIIDGVGIIMFYVEYWFEFKFYGHIHVCMRSQLSIEFIFSIFLVFLAKSSVLKRS